MRTYCSCANTMGMQPCMQALTIHAGWLKRATGHAIFVPIADSVQTISEGTEVIIASLAKSAITGSL